MPPSNPIDRPRGSTLSWLNRPGARTNGPNTPLGRAPVSRAIGRFSLNDLVTFRGRLQARTRQCELTTAFYLHYPKQMETAYKMACLPEVAEPDIFLDKMLDGVRNFGSHHYGDLYRMLNNEVFGSVHLTMFYHLGQVYAQAEQYDPATIDLLNQITLTGLKAPSLLKIFILGRNFSRFTWALDFLVRSGNSELRRPIAEIFYLTEARRPETSAKLAQDQIDFLTNIINLGQSLKEVKAALDDQDVSALSHSLSRAAGRGQRELLLPTIVPQLLAQRAELAQRSTGLLKSLLRFFQPNPEIKAIDDLLAELAQIPEGRDELLCFAYETLISERVLSRSFKGQLEELLIPTQLLRNLLRTVLLEAETRPVPAFNQKSRAEGIREAIVDLARVNGLKPESRQLSRAKVGRTLLALAIKVQQFSEQTAAGNLNGLGMLEEELHQLAAAKDLALVFPYVKLINRFSKS